MRYVGFHNENTLPVKSGMKVVIPAGVKIRSTHPSKREYVSKRPITPIIHHVMPGQSTNISMFIGNDYYKRQQYPDAVEYFAAYDKLRADLDRETDHDKRRAMHEEYFKMSIPTANPSVCWAGTGGYWCEADINDILEANSL